MNLQDHMEALALDCKGLARETGLSTITIYQALQGKPVIHQTVNYIVKALSRKYGREVARDEVEGLIIDQEPLKRLLASSQEQNHCQAWNQWRMQRRSTIRSNSVDLSEADFGEADLSGADLSGADLTGTNLQGCQMNGARLDITVHGEPLWPEIAASSEWAAIQEEAQSPTTPAERLVELATHWPGYQVRHLLVANPNFPQEQVIALASQFPRAFLTNPVLPWWFIGDPNWLTLQEAQSILLRAQQEPDWLAWAEQHANLVAPLEQRCARRR